MRKITILFFCFSAKTLWAQVPKLVLPIGHTSAIQSVSFSPGGKLTATSAFDHTVKIWDTEKGFLLLNLLIHSEKVNTVSFSPDGKIILTASNDSTAKLCDARTGRLMVSLVHSSIVREASFSPDGNRILTVTVDYTAKIWDAKTGKLLQTLKGPDKSASFSPDGKKVVNYSADKTVEIWDANSGRRLSALTGHSYYIYHTSFSPDGNKIVSASGDGTAKIWDAKTGQLLFTLEGHSDAVLNASFSPDSKRVVTSSRDNTAKIWDAVSGILLFSLEAHTASLTSAVFSPASPNDPTGGSKIVTSSMDNTSKIWDAKTGKLLFDLKGHTDYVNAAIFSKNGRKVATASNDNTVIIWDANSGIMLTQLKGHTHPVVNASVSPNAKILITNSEFNPSKLWNAENGNLIYTLRGHKGYVQYFSFSPDGKKIVTASTDSTIKIWDIQTGSLLVNLDGRFEELEHLSFTNELSILTVSKYQAKLWNAQTGKLSRNLKGVVYDAYFSAFGIKTVESAGYTTIQIRDVLPDSIITQFKGHTEPLFSASFFSNGNKIITAAWDSKIKIWDARNGNQLAELQGNFYEPKITVSPDGTQISTLEYNKVKIWDAQSGELITGINYKSHIQVAGFSPDGTRIITGSSDGTIQLWDSKTGKPIYELLGHTESIIGASFFPGSKKIISTTYNETKIWDATRGKLLYTFFALDDNEYLILSPGNYYFSSLNAPKLLHYVTADLRVISFEQLDVKYNRPDKVLEAIGSTDTALIKSYRKAYEKRIKKLGIDTTAFRSGYSVPEADFVNRDKIEFEQRDGKLKLEIKSGDSTYKLDRFNIWINETPVYGQRGISVRNKNVNNFDSIITINLSQGQNKIETSITNVNGTESYRMPLQVNYTPANDQAGKTYFIGIGIDQFVDSKYNLKYSTKDIRDLSQKLKEKYADIIIDTLFNENVSISNVKGLKQKLLQTNVNDKVIISYSGHGMLSKDFDYYLSTYAVNFEVPEENGLPYDELESLLDSIPARKKLMLIDACHSGEVDKDDLIALDAIDKKLIKGLKPVAYKTGGRLGLKNSFELMQSLFVNVGKSTGATIISAAAGTQFALEGVDNLPNGVFTYCILEAMTTYPSMKISELKKIVGERVVEITKGLQKPTSRNETIAVDWEIWNVK